MAICEEAGPGEKTVAEEGKKVKNQDAVDLGIYEVPEGQGQMKDSSHSTGRCCC